MKRGSWITRHTRLKPGKGIKPKKRSPEEFERIHGSDKRVEFVQMLPCLICARIPSENAHVGNGGMSRKADADRSVPLCGDWVNGHHTEYDTGKKTFVRVHALELQGMTMLEHAARVEAAWQEWQAQTGLTPLSAIVPGVVAEILEGNA